MSVGDSWKAWEDYQDLCREAQEAGLLAIENERLRAELAVNAKLLATATDEKTILLGRTWRLEKVLRKILEESVPRPAPNLSLLDALASAERVLAGGEDE